ncbi:MAG: O-antigen ligase family protein [Betaproteobacteria bacterium]|nr:O-antigen ligase family protein [Betaproteobacteria bacterium]MDH3436662.1 O-antigen ligase family protein [Betaproteobacteria bacterium]
MGSGIFRPISSGADRGARWCAVALGFSLPISVALDSILLGLVLVGFALGGAYAEKWRAIRDNPVVLAALALYAMLLIGCLYGEAATADRLSFLSKYSDLLGIPLLIHFFRDAATRRQGITALAASLALVLLWSTLFKLGVIPQLPFTHGNEMFPVVFKLKLTHNLLMAFAAFLFTYLALAAGDRRLQLTWAALAVLAVINVTLMVQGATGYLVMALLALYVGYGWRGWRGIAAAAAVGAVLFGTLAVVPGPFQQRMQQMVREASQLRPGHAPPEPSQITPGNVFIESSLGRRLEFYRGSLAIIGDHPVIGVGTGGFPKAYVEKTKETSPYEVRNPHNEYLLMMSQTGLIGLVLLLHLFWRQWRLAPRLATPLETHLARGLVLTIAAGCLFNSFLLDHTEGLLFAWMTGLLYAGLQSREIGNRE